MNNYFNVMCSQILQLRKRLGYVFNVITGNVTGHYFLDLSDTLHRKARKLFTLLLVLLALTTVQ